MKNPLEIAEGIMSHIQDETKELSREDYIEVLNEVVSQLDTLVESMENDEEE